MPEREIECRRFERPAPVFGLPGLQQRERVECVLPHERQLAAARLEPLLRGRVVVDLLAAAPLAAAAEHDDGALEREVGGNFLLERPELVPVDLERQVLDGVVGGHTPEPSRHGRCQAPTAARYECVTTRPQRSHRAVTCAMMDPWWGCP